MLAGGLETIALAALQQLQAQRTSSTTTTTTAAENDGNDRGMESIQMPVKEEQRQLSSSSVVVSPTGSEEEVQKEKETNPPPPVRPPVSENGNNTRVISFGSMASCNSIESDNAGGPGEGDDAPPATSPAVCSTTNTTKVNAPPAVLTKKSTASIPEMSPLTDFSVILDNPEGWLQMMEPYFSTSLNNTNVDTTTIITEPQPFDVLCGRGGESNNAQGNIQYRRLVKSYQKLYVDATRRIKPKIAQCIVFSVRQAGGRFLKRVEVTDTSDRKDGSSASPGWIDVGNVKAREKTSQALRENAPDLRGTATAAAAGQGDVESKPSSVARGHEFSSHPTSPGFYKQSPSLLASNIPPPVSPLNPSPLPKVGSLMHHPLFSCLSPLQKQQIMMMELQTARDNPALTHYARNRNGQAFARQINDISCFTQHVQQQHPHQNVSKRSASSTMAPASLDSDGSETSSNNSHGNKGCGPRLKRLKSRIQEEADTCKEM